MRDGRLDEVLDTQIKGEVMSEVVEMVAMLAKSRVNKVARMV